MIRQEIGLLAVWIGPQRLSRNLASVDCPACAIDAVPAAAEVEATC